MKPTIYIAGPMRGKKDYNRAAFNAAAERLAARGWHPINPVDIEKIYPCTEANGSLSHIDLVALMAIEREFAELADAIYLLDGWEESIGAKRELSEFLKNGDICHLESNGTPDATLIG